MIRQYKRELTKKEKNFYRKQYDFQEAENKKLKSGTTRGSIIALMLMALCVRIFGLDIPDNLGWINVVVGLVLLGAIVYLMISIDSYRNWAGYHKRYFKEIWPKHKKLLDAGEIQVTQVKANSVTVIEQFEDEGDGFVFDVGKNKSLFLKGQVYDFPLNDGSWPNTEFEILRLPGKKYVEGVWVSGKKLKTKKKFESKNYRSEKVLWGTIKEVKNVAAEKYLEDLLK